MSNILVLNYHQLLPKEKADLKSVKQKYSTTELQFIAQLDLIDALGVPVVSMREWSNNTRTNDFAIAITFDGGYASDYEIAMPILKRFGYTATFFPVLSELDNENKISQSQLNELVENGFEIGSHGIKQSTSRLDKEACKLELELSKRIFEKKIGKPIQYFSVSGRMYNRRLLQLAYNAGYTKVLSTKAKQNSDRKSFVIHRLNIKQNTSYASIIKAILSAKRIAQQSSVFTRLNIQSLKAFGIGFFNKANSLILKQTNK